MLDDHTLARLDRANREQLQDILVDRDPENALMGQFLGSGLPLCREFPFLVAFSWPVTPGRPQDGTGDLVLASRRGSFAVVELKALPDIGDRHGRTRRNRREKRRQRIKKCEIQAARYTAAWRRRWSRDTEIMGFAVLKWPDGRWTVRPVPSCDPELATLKAAVG